MSSKLNFRDPALLLNTLQQLLQLEALEVHPTLVAVTNLLAATFQADKVDVFLYQPDSETLVAMGTSETPMGTLQKDLNLHILPLTNGGRIAEVFRSGVPHIDGHVERDPVELEGVKHDLKIRSALATPFAVDGDPRGVLLISSAQPDFYTQSSLDFLISVARWVGMTTHRAELVEHSKKHAVLQARRTEAEEILTVLAHDFKNLMMPLAMYLMLLRKSTNEAGRTKDRSLVEQIEASITYLKRLTDNLLDVARIDRGLFTLDPSVVEVASLVEEVVARFNVHGTEFTFDVVDHPRARLDVIRFEIAISNLLSNALFHAPSEEPVAVRVSEKQEGDEGWVEITITDQGPGIEEAMLPYLFERYTTGHPGTGLGLGLYVASQIAKAHGGALNVASRRGEGTTFSFTVPKYE